MTCVGEVRAQCYQLPTHMIVCRRIMVGSCGCPTKSRPARGRCWVSVGGAAWSRCRTEFANRTRRRSVSRGRPGRAVVFCRQGRGSSNQATAPDSRGVRAPVADPDRGSAPLPPRLVALFWPVHETLVLPLRQPSACRSLPVTFLLGGVRCRLIRGAGVGAERARRARLTATSPPM